MTTPTLTPKATKEPERKFQHYACSRQAMRMITPEGRKITFVGHKYITAEEAIIAYLDAEIANGLRVITKGELLTSLEADPLEALRRKHVAEYLASQKAEEKQDMGSTKTPAQLLNAINPTGTDKVPNKAQS